MYKYKIGYGSPEASSYTEFEHKQLFSESDITLMIAEAVKELWSTVYDPKFPGLVTFQHFWYYIPDWLVAKKGFVRVVYDRSWSVFGWGSVIDKGDWGTYREEKDNLDEICEYLEQHGIKAPTIEEEEP